MIEIETYTTITTQSEKSKVIWLDSTVYKENNIEVQNLDGTHSCWTQIHGDICNVSNMQHATPNSERLGQHQKVVHKTKY